MKKNPASPARSDAPDTPAPPAHDEGQTTPARDGERVPKQPHERDESSESQQRAPDPVMHQARADIERGLSDTSKGEATEKTYARNLRSDPPDAASDEATEQTDTRKLRSDAAGAATDKPTDKPPEKSR